MGKLLVLYGPSAAGKSEIQNMLASIDLPKIITVTTRPPRADEIHGVHYHFTDRSDFQEKIDQDQLIEWTEYNGEFYGTLTSSIEEIIHGGTIAHIIMDIQGVLALKEHFAQIVAVYIGADIESIRRRLQDRGSSQEEISWRLEKAVTEELSPSYQSVADYIIWNNDSTDFRETVGKIKQIIAQESLS